MSSHIQRGNESRQECRSRTEVISIGVGCCELGSMPSGLGIYTASPGPVRLVSTLLPVIHVYEFLPSFSSHPLVLIWKLTGRTQ